MQLRALCVGVGTVVCSHTHTHAHTHKQTHTRTRMRACVGAAVRGVRPVRAIPGPGDAAAADRRGGEAAGVHPPGGHPGQGVWAGACVVQALVLCGLSGEAAGVHLAATLEKGFRHVLGAAGPCVCSRAWFAQPWGRGGCRVAAGAGVGGVRQGEAAAGALRSKVKRGMKWGGVWGRVRCARARGLD